jgi:hypothetical protein
METTNRWIICTMFNGYTRESWARLEEWRGPNADAVRSEDVRVIELPGRHTSRRAAVDEALAYCEANGLVLHHVPQA